jgi:5'(3')-deoxyribonucleotidase
MPSDKGQIVLGVDLDGVCADFYERMRHIAAEYLEVDVNTLTKDVSYGLPEWGVRQDGGAHYRSLHRFAVTQRNLFGSVEMIPGARRVLRVLSAEDYRIRIITHRLFIDFFHDLAVRQTVEWLDHHGIPYSDLCFMKDKDQVGADIYVEDSPENIRSLRRNGHYAICFANSTNKEIEAPRAKDWDEVYQLTKNHANTGAV